MEMDGVQTDGARGNEAEERDKEIRGREASKQLRDGDRT